MPKLAANLTLLFTEYDVYDRFDVAARAGFRGVEFLFPFDYSIHTICERLQRNDLEMVLIDCPPGNWDAGDRGMACDPRRREEFRAGVEEAIRFATAFDCHRVNCLSGKIPAGRGEALIRETLVDNLKYAAERLGEVGMTLLLEPINHRDMPGFALSRSEQAVDLIHAVGLPNLKLQYDIYHMQVMEGDIATHLTRYQELLGHIQVGDNPGRHEPGTGELNYPFLFEHLDQLGYEGWVAAEYFPIASTEAGLDWARPYLD